MTDLFSLWLILISCVSNILLVIFSIDMFYRHVWLGFSFKWMVFGIITLSFALALLFAGSIDAYKLVLKIASSPL